MKTFVKFTVLAVLVLINILLECMGTDIEEIIKWQPLSASNISKMEPHFAAGDRKQYICRITRPSPFYDIKFTHVGFYVSGEEKCSTVYSRISEKQVSLEIETTPSEIEIMTDTSGKAEWVEIKDKKDLEELRKSMVPGSKFISQSGYICRMSKTEENKVVVLEGKNASSEEDSKLLEQGLIGRVFLTDVVGSDCLGAGNGNEYVLAPRFEVLTVQQIEGRSMSDFEPEPATQSDTCSKESFTWCPVTKFDFKTNSQPHYDSGPKKQYICRSTSVLHSYYKQKLMWVGYYEHPATPDRNFCFCADQRTIDNYVQFWIEEDASQIEIMTLQPGTFEWVEVAGKEELEKLRPKMIHVATYLDDMKGYICRQSKKKFNTYSGSKRPKLQEQLEHGLIGRVIIEEVVPSVSSPECVSIGEAFRQMTASRFEVLVKKN